LVDLGGLSSLQHFVDYIGTLTMLQKDLPAKTEIHALYGEDGIKKVQSTLRVKLFNFKK